MSLDGVLHLCWVLGVVLLLIASGLIVLNIVVHVTERARRHPRMDEDEEG